MLKIMEEFYTLQGEGLRMGVPSYFIRLGYCHFTCGFCDSKFTWKPKNYSSINTLEEVNNYVDKIDEKYQENVDIVITGGEPLWHENIPLLTPMIRSFLNQHTVTIETTLTTKPDDIKNKNIDDVLSDILQDPYLVSRESGKFMFSVSPKLNMTAYENMDITIDNVLDYYKPSTDGVFNYCYYKFVHEKETEEVMIDFIKNRLHQDDLGNIYLMPVTPFPFVKDVYEENKRVTAELCKKLQVNYSARLHIDLWGLKRGV